MSDERLHDKFRVERTDPEAQERHKDCWVFVLEPEHDPAARIALKAYADAVAEDGNYDLAGGLRLKVLENGWLL